MQFEWADIPRNIRSFPNEIDHQPILWVDGTTHYRILRTDLTMCMSPERCEHLCIGSCMIPRCKFKGAINDSKVIEINRKEI